MKNTIVGYTAALVLAFLAAPVHAVQLANPASVHCLERGGTRITVKTPLGVRADCLLPTGKRIDEWRLFRRDKARRK